MGDIALECPYDFKWVMLTRGAKRWAMLFLSEERDIQKRKGRARELQYGPYWVISALECSDEPIGSCPLRSFTEWLLTSYPQSWIMTLPSNRVAEGDLRVEGGMMGRRWAEKQGHTSWETRGQEFYTITLFTVVLKPNLSSPVALLASSIRPNTSEQWRCKYSIHKTPVALDRESHSPSLEDHWPVRLTKLGMATVPRTRKHPTLDSRLLSTLLSSGPITFCLPLINQGHWFPRSVKSFVWGSVLTQLSICNQLPTKTILEPQRPSLCLKPNMFAWGKHRILQKIVLSTQMKKCALSFPGTNKKTINRKRHCMKFTSPPKEQYTLDNYLSFIYLASFINNLSPL